MVEKRNKNKYNNKRRSKYTAFEKLLFSLTLISLLIAPFAIIFTQAKLSKLNIEVETIKSDIVLQERENQSIQMRINLLASRERIEEILEFYGTTVDNAFSSMDSN